MSNVLDLIKASRKARCDLVPHLSDDDVSKVWEAVCQVVVKNMLDRRATVIKNLGKFTYTTSYHTATQKHSLVFQRLVFIVCDKLVSTHRLLQPARKITGEHHVSHLNWTELGIITGLRREDVEMCVTEIAQSFMRAHVNNTNVQMLFPSVGVLYVNDRNIKMKFFKTLLKQIDQTGHITNSMKQSCLCLYNK